MECEWTQNWTTYFTYMKTKKSDMKFVQVLFSCEDCNDFISADTYSLILDPTQFSIEMLSHFSF